MVAFSRIADTSQGVFARLTRMGIPDRDIGILVLGNAGRAGGALTRSQITYAAARAFIDAQTQEEAFYAWAIFLYGLDKVKDLLRRFNDFYGMFPGAWSHTKQGINYVDSVDPMDYAFVCRASIGGGGVNVIVTFAPNASTGGNHNGTMKRTASHEARHNYVFFVECIMFALYFSCVAAVKQGVKYFVVSPLGCGVYAGIHRKKIRKEFPRILEIVLNMPYTHDDGTHGRICDFFRKVILAWPMRNGDGRGSGGGQNGWCAHGPNCYRQNPGHIAQYHPPGHHPAPKPRSDGKAQGQNGGCVHGSNCYRKNPEHLAQCHPPGYIPAQKPRSQSSRCGSSRSRSVSRNGGPRSRSVSRNGGSRSRSVSRSGGFRSHSVSRNGGPRSRSVSHSGQNSGCEYGPDCYRANLEHHAQCHPPGYIPAQKPRSQSSRRGSSRSRSVSRSGQITHNGGSRSVSRSGGFPGVTNPQHLAQFHPWVGVGAHDVVGDGQIPHASFFLREYRPPV
jgi:hypothetical protein